MPAKSTLYALDILPDPITSAANAINLYEDGGSGVNFISLKSPAALASSISFTFPTTQGSSGQVLTTDGSGGLSWTTSGWGLTGNAGTTAGTNFVGTTDAQDLVLKRNNSTQLTLTSAGLSASVALNMSNAVISNIGAAGTDFSATGGLTLADKLTVSTGGLDITGTALFRSAVQAENFTQVGTAAYGNQPLYVLNSSPTFRTTRIANFQSTTNNIGALEVEGGSVGHPTVLVTNSTSGSGGGAIHTTGHIGLLTTSPIRFYTGSSGTNYTSVTVNAAQAVNIDWVLPTTQGAASSVLTNDGSGNLSWGAGQDTTLQALVWMGW